MGKREIEMLETVTQRNFPDVFTATYEAKGVWNEVINRFSELEGGRTSWTIETEFRCSGILWLMTKLMPGMFKKETPKTMDAFKAFAKNNPS